MLWRPMSMAAWVLATGATCTLLALLGVHAAQAAEGMPLAEGAAVETSGLPPPAFDDDAAFERFLDELLTPRPAPRWIRDGGPVVIGILEDGPSGGNGDRDIFIAEISGLAGEEFDLRFPERHQLHGDWDIASVAAKLDALLAAPDVDLVLATGFLGSITAARRAALPKPVIAPHVVDPDALGIPQRHGGSGVANLAYLTTLNPMLRDLEAFQELTGFAHAAVLASQRLLDAAPELRENTLAMAAERGLRVEVVPVEDSAAEALSRAGSAFDAVYVLPLPHLAESEQMALVDMLTAQGLPSFSRVGRADVERGILAAIAPEADAIRLARRVALYVQRILLGERPEDLPAAFPAGERLILNMETARAIGFYPTWSMLAEAELLHEEPAAEGIALTLEAALLRALGDNLDLEAESRALAADAQSPRAARAHLLPRIEARTRAVWLDRDSASPLQRERQWSGAIQVRQVLYSDLARANAAIAERLHEARRQAYAVRRLDMMELAAEAYLNVLRARTFESVQRDDLRVTRENLDLARVRQSAGAANPGEVFRWESQMAQSRTETLEAASLRGLAELQLKQALNLPQDLPVRLEDMGPEDPLLQFSLTLAEEYLDNPWKLKLFLDLMIAIGVENAPELAGIDAAISAAERGELASRRSYYTPDVALQGEIRHIFGEGGAGAGGGLASRLVPSPPDTGWHVGVEASLPLYTGGARKAERIAARESLAELRARRASAESRVEQRIRAAMERIRASWPAIRHKEESAAAAEKNLLLVTDAYGRGLAEITDLLDAQRAALGAKLAAAGAVYDYLLDLVALERATSDFAIFLSEASRQAWIVKVEALVHDDETEAAP